MTERPIPYGRQTITEADLEAVREALLSDYLTQGPRIAEFEQAFAAFVGARYAVALSNGTAALHLAAMALDAGPHTRIITSPITFAASANGVAFCGGQVDFADIDPHTYVLDPAAVRRMLEAAPRGTYSGIVAVSFAGYPAPLEAFRALADEFGLWLVEDACHSPGAWFTTRSGAHARSGDGQFAHMAVFSLHPVKHIASGEGGLITTNDPALYERLLRLRTHGITRDPKLMAENHGGWYYDMVELGYNYRLTDVQAALAHSQLKQIGWSLERRQEIAARYDAAFAGTALQLPWRAADIYHAFHLYVIQTDHRKELYDFLKTRNIFTQVHYIPVHTLSYYRRQHPDLKLPVAEAYYARCLSLPMYPGLSHAEQDYVIACVQSFLSQSHS